MLAKINSFSKPSFNISLRTFLVLFVNIICLKVDSAVQSSGAYMVDSVGQVGDFVMNEGVRAEVSKNLNTDLLHGTFMNLLFPESHDSSFAHENGFVSKQDVEEMKMGFLVMWKSRLALMLLCESEFAKYFLENERNFPVFNATLDCLIIPSSGTIVGFTKYSTNLKSVFDIIHMDKLNDVKFHICGNENFDVEYLKVIFSADIYGKHCFGNGQESAIFKKYPALYSGLYLGLKMIGNEAVIVTGVPDIDPEISKTHSFVAINSAEYFLTWDVFQSEVIKVYMGFSKSELKRVVTGQLGQSKTGFFGLRSGWDTRLMFIVQWIAASLAGKEMHYCLVGASPDKNKNETLLLGKIKECVQSKGIASVLGTIKVYFGKFGWKSVDGLIEAIVSAK